MGTPSSFKALDLADILTESYNPMWNQARGIAFANLIESICIQHGAHCMMGGSVLHRGYSSKDLDIIIYPHGKTPYRKSYLLFHIQLALWYKYRSWAEFDHYELMYDKKDVVGMFFDDRADTSYAHADAYCHLKRVDFFFF